MKNRMSVIALSVLAIGCSAPAGAPVPAPSGGERVTSALADTHDPRRLDVIAFGSCSDEDQPQPLWSPILANEPDLWVWLGDIIYADTEDMGVMASKYEMQRAQPGYLSLTSGVPVIGTWDDHDYGANNAGREYPKRAESQQLLLDFLGVPDASPRRDRAGAYASHTYGPEGERVKVILLDVRYHRDPRGSGGTLLGEAQWRWLESQLSDSDARIHLIGSGIQILPVDHPYEKWENFPADRARLFDLIARTRAPGVVLLSGDRHIAEIMRYTDPRVPYPIYEITASGMTHSWEDADEPNRYRLGDLMTELNFGTIEIDWAGEAPEVRLQVRDVENAIRLEQRVPLNALRWGAQASTVERKISTTTGSKWEPALVSSSRRTLSGSQAGR